jgi:radical SAM superfamily enzyme YgiQ (UPF0313 family)
MRPPIRLLLVNPRFPESFWSFRWAVDTILPGKRAVNPPLGLATLAALSPKKWQITIVDENIESIPLAPEADIVGICGMGVQFPRQRELLEFYRARGYFVVAGGSYASLCPERYERIADAVVAGEAEYIWKDFCRDYEAGAPRSLYHETGVVSLEDSPPPRFDLLDLDKYTTVTLQFSRGCPFLCDFCDIIVMFGRKPRFKTTAQVGRELDLLRERGVRNVFFVDDNLIGNKKAARELLRFLRDYQAQHRYTFSFGSEASLNLAGDAELLQLFRDAHFSWLFVGIESADTASLAEAGKVQNLKEDLLVSVRKLYAHGIDVLAGFIVGFDNDTLDTFDVQYRFIMESGIQAAMIGLLTALPRTPLYRRLEQEGRLISDAEHEHHTDNTRLGTNFLPRRMAYADMIDAYKALYRRLLSDRAIAERIRNKTRHMRQIDYQAEYTHLEALGVVVRLVRHGILKGGVARTFHFLRSLPLLRPRAIPLAIVDWIAGLSMREYVQRHFGLREAHEDLALARAVARLSRAVRAYTSRGAVVVQLEELVASVPRLHLCLSAGLDRTFWRRTARHVHQLLRRTSSHVTLRLDAVAVPDLSGLEHLLQRLAPYGDRIRVVMTEKLLRMVPVDTSVFHLQVAQEPR